MTNSFGQYIGKITRTAVLAGAFSLYSAIGYSNGTELPVNYSVLQSITQKKDEANAAYEKTIDALITQYQQKVRSAVTSFNEGIKDSKYTLKEQNETITHFLAYPNLEDIAKKDPKMKHLVWKIDSKSGFYVESIKDDRLNLKESDKKLSLLLSETLFKVDTDTPSLEIELRKQGLAVTVEPTLSSDEILFTVLGVGIFVAGLGYCISKSQE